MAKKTISQRIALEGGEAIKGALKSLGASGEKAFKQIQAAADKAKTPAARIGKALQDVRLRLIDLSKAAQNLRARLGRLGRSLRDLGGAAGTVAKRIGLVTAAAGLAAGAVFRLAQGGAGAADAARKQSQEFGIAIDSYGRLSFAAEQSGVSQDELRAAMARVNREVGEADKGNKTSIARFAALGVSVRNARGELRPTEEILADIADRFAAMPDGATKSALAIDLMGRSGARMIPLLNGGSAGLADLGDQAERLGIVFTKEQAVIAEGMNDALNALGRARRGVSGQIGLLFAPTITAAAKHLTDLITDNRRAIEGLAEDGLEAALPVLRDFVNALLGNDQDVNNLWVIQARDAIIGFAQSVGSAINNIIRPAFTAIQDGADILAGAFNKALGTDFTGTEILIAAFVAKVVGLFGLLGASVGVVSSAISVVVASVGLLGPVASVFASIFAAISTGASVVLSGLVALLGWPALLIAALVGAGVAIFVFWDDIKAGASNLWGFLRSLFASGADFLAQWASSIGSVLAGAFDAVQVAAASVFSWLRDAGSDVATFVSDAWSGLGDIIASVWAGVARVASDSVALAKSVFLGGFSGIFDGILAIAAIAWNGLISGFEVVGDAVWDVFKGILSRITSLFSGLTSLAKAAAAKVRSAFSSGGGSASGSQAPRAQGFSVGGHVRGAGTPTSDSIPAWLSDTEFVQRSKAVKYYGVNFMHALNGLKIKRETLFSALRGVAPQRFAAGGLVRMPQMRFTPQIAMAGFSAGIMPEPVRLAQGGPVIAPSSSGRPVNLNIMGETVNGLTGTPDAIDQLQRLSARQGVARTGRAPSWIGGGK